MTLPFLFLDVLKIQLAPSPADPTGSSLPVHIHCLRAADFPWTWLRHSPGHTYSPQTLASEDPSLICWENWSHAGLFPICRKLSEPFRKWS